MDSPAFYISVSVVCAMVLTVSVALAIVTSGRKRIPSIPSVFNARPASGTVSNSNIRQGQRLGVIGMRIDLAMPIIKSAYPTMEIRVIKAHAHEYSEDWRGKSGPLAVAVVMYNESGLVEDVVLEPASAIQHAKS